MLGLEPFNTGIAAVVLLIVLVVLGVRVFVAAALTGFLGLLELRGWNVAAAISGTILHSKTITYPLSVLPLFILIGFLAFYAGLTGRLFEAARRWAGWVTSDRTPGESFEPYEVLNGQAFNALNLVIWH